MANSNSDLWRLQARLLQYPTDTIASEARKYQTLLASTLPGEEKQAERFVSFVESTPLGRIEEIYSATFDLSPECCPYVGYHLFGEDPKRNDLMVRLQESYKAAGFDAGTELPDHVAVLLGFLTEGSPSEDLQHDLLTDLLAPGLEKMTKSLGEKNPYKDVVQSTLSVVTACAEANPRPAGEEGPSLPAGGSDV